MLKYPQLKDYIFKYKLLPDDLCDQLIERINKRKWSDHHWYDPKDNGHNNYKDFKTLKDNVASSKIFPLLKDLCIEFNNKYYQPENTNSSLLWTMASNVKFNKYSVGDSIQPHHDHIHEMFDGTRKGIPSVSIIGLLNDDFEGGELEFPALGLTIRPYSGLIITFPSYYEFAHRVNPVTKGERKALVTWIQTHGRLASPRGTF